MAKLTATSKPLGAERLTVNTAAVVPLLPSLTVTSLIERFGVAPPAQLFAGELELRGNAVEVRKSAAFWSVSAQPPALR